MIRAQHRTNASRDVDAAKSENTRSVRSWGTFEHTPHLSDDVERHRTAWREHDVERGVWIHRDARFDDA
jgi:hypothetical protein